MELILIALVFLFLSAAQAALIGRFGLRGFSYRRSFSRSAVFPGDTAEYVEVIRNRGPLYLPWVRLETRIPPSFEFLTREEVEIRGSNYHKSLFALTPFSQVTRRHRVVLHRRGHFLLPRAALTAGDLLGLRLASRDVFAPAEIYVYPRLLEEERSLPASLEMGDAAVRRWIQPDPFLISGIRGYRMGDPERDIHWPATARMGALQVKTRDYTAVPRLMVLINGQKSEEQWGELTEEEKERVEYAISLAATLCAKALSQGREAGFGANMPLDEEEACACLLPMGGSGRTDALLRAFARLRIRFLLSFPTFLEQLPALSRCDILILSCYESDAIRRQMDRLRSLGNSVELCRLEGGVHG